MCKFLKCVFSFVLCAALLSSCICYFIDPFNVFHPFHIRCNGAEPNKNYIKMKYILANPDVFDTFIFGSSRVGNLHTDKILDEKCYNMTYSLGTPQENLDNIKTFLSHGIKPKKVYLGLDSLSYTTNPIDHRSDLLRAPYEYSKTNPLKFWNLYFDPAIAVKSLFLKPTSFGLKEGFDKVFYSYGWNIDYHFRSFFTEEKDWAEIGESFLLDEALYAVQEIVDICRENNIGLVVFTNPVYKATYLASVELSYFDFLKRLAEITPFYNFSSLNDITTDVKSFMDPGHYTAETGDLILDCICNNVTDKDLQEQGFGIIINEDNIDNWIAIFEMQVSDSKIA